MITDRRFPLTISIILFLILLLIIANLFKYEILSADLFTENKNFIDAFAKVISTSLLVIGSIVTYFRFFHDWLWAPSAKISLSSNVIKFDESSNLHLIHLDFENIGNITIWNPEATLMAHQHPSEIDESGIEIEWFSTTDLYKTPISKKTILISSKESEQFFAKNIVDKSIKAVTYIATVKTKEQNALWTKAITVPNSVKEPNE